MPEKNDSEVIEKDERKKPGNFSCELLIILIGLLFTVYGVIKLFQEKRDVDCPSFGNCIASSMPWTIAFLIFLFGCLILAAGIISLIIYKKN